MPVDVVTVTLPVVAPAGTVAVISLEETTVNAAAGVAPKLTPVAPFKFAPEIVTMVPTFPLRGVIEVTAGFRDTVKLVVLETVPAGVETEMGPVTAPAGTVATI